MYQQQLETLPLTNRESRAAAASRTHIRPSLTLSRLMVIAVILISGVTLSGLGNYLIATSTQPIDPRSLSCNHWDLSIKLGDRVPEVIDYARTELVPELQQAIQRNPTCANLYWTLGDVQLWLGENDQALSSYRRYLEMAGSDVDAKVNGLVTQLTHDLAH